MTAHPHPTGYSPNAGAEDHELVEIGGGKYEYRGFFISKTNFDRQYTILKPAPSKEVFCYADTLWDVEEKIDAFLDRGVDPWPEEEAEGSDPTEYHWPNNQRAI